MSKGTFKIIARDQPHFLHSTDYWGKEKAQKRIDSGDAHRFLMPEFKDLKFVVVHGTAMNNIRIYDNKGETFDRYTVVFLDEPESNGMFSCLGMSTEPFMPNGFCQHSSCQDGPHLGKRTSLHKLPLDCQRAIVDYYLD